MDQKLRVFGASSWLEIMIRTDMVELSVIIPVFNGEATITRCLDSIFNGEFPDSFFEVVVVDDCSSDNTVKLIATSYASHNNIRIIRSVVNGRQGGARNIGISASNGRYIAFVDADDELCFDGISKAISFADANNVDICYFDIEYNTPDGSWNRVTSGFSGALSSHEFLEKYYHFWFNAVWRNIYRASFLKSSKVHFVEKVRWEDCDWTLKVYSLAGRIGSIEGLGYRYWYNPLSTSRQFSSMALSERVYAGYRLFLFVADKSKDLPLFCMSIKSEAWNNYIFAMLRYRNITKYSITEIKEIYAYIDSYVVGLRAYLCDFSLDSWVSFFLKRRVLTLFVLFLSRPFILAGRGVLRWCRRVF